MNTLPPGLAGFVQGRQQAAQEGQMGMENFAKFAPLRGILQSQQEDQVIKGILASPEPMESKLQKLAATGQKGIAIGQGLLQQDKLATDARQARRVADVYGNPSLYTKPQWPGITPADPVAGGMGPVEAGPMQVDANRLGQLLLSAGSPEGEKILQHQATRDQARAQLAATQQNYLANQQLRQDQIRATEENARLARESANERAQMADQRTRDLAASRTAQASRPSITDIADPLDPNSTLRVDATKFNEERYKAGDRTGVIGTGPKLTQTGTAAFKNATQMQGFASDIQSAEDLLMGNKRDQYGNVMSGSKPTSSVLGRIGDVAGSIVGWAPPGAEEAAALKTVAARLTQRIPRFEGPQSNKDVAEYKEAAGSVGNENLPLATRLAAVRKMRELYTGYEDGSRGRLVQQQVQNPNQGQIRRPGSAPAVGTEGVVNGVPAIWDGMGWKRK